MLRNLSYPVSLALFVGILVLGFFSGLAHAGSQKSENPIYPTWKMLSDTTNSGEAKRWFIAGYLYGHKEAQALGEVAVEYVKQNGGAHMAPGLERILPHYRLSTMTANQLVPLLNKHLSDADNQDQSLRVAINQVN